MLIVIYELPEFHSQFTTLSLRDSSCAQFRFPTLSFTLSASEGRTLPPYRSALHHFPPCSAQRPSRYEFRLSPSEQVATPHSVSLNNWLLPTLSHYYFIRIARSSGSQSRRHNSLSLVTICLSLFAYVFSSSFFPLFLPHLLLLLSDRLREPLLCSITRSRPSRLLFPRRRHRPTRLPRRIVACSLLDPSVSSLRRLHASSYIISPLLILVSGLVCNNTRPLP